MEVLAASTEQVQFWVSELVHREGDSSVPQPTRDWKGPGLQGQ